MSDPERNAQEQEAGDQLFCGHRGGDHEVVGLDAVEQLERTMTLGLPVDEVADGSTRKCQRNSQRSGSRDGTDQTAKRVVDDSCLCVGAGEGADDRVPHDAVSVQVERKQHEDCVERHHGEHT